MEAGVFCGLKLRGGAGELRTGQLATLARTHGHGSGGRCEMRLPCRGVARVRLPHMLMVPRQSCKYSIASVLNHNRIDRNDKDNI